MKKCERQVQEKRTSRSVKLTETGKYITKSGWGLGLLGISAVAISLWIAGVNPDKVYSLVYWAVHAIIAWALYGKSPERH